MRHNIKKVFLLILFLALFSFRESEAFYDLFEGTPSYRTGDRPSSFFVSDINADSINEVIISDYLYKQLTIYKIRKDRTIEIRESISVSGHPVSLAPGDFDMDGNLDIAAAYPNEKVVALWFGDGKDHFSESMRLPISMRPTQIIADDLDNDGFKDDFVILSHFESIFLVSIDADMQETKAYETRRGPYSVEIHDSTMTAKRTLSFPTALTIQYPSIFRKGR